MYHGPIRAFCQQSAPKNPQAATEPRPFNGHLVGQAPIIKFPAGGVAPPGKRKKQKRTTGLCFIKKGGQNPNAASCGRLAAIPHTLDPEAPAGLILNAIGVSL